MTHGLVGEASIFPGDPRVGGFMPHPTTKFEQFVS